MKMLNTFRAYFSKLAFGLNAQPDLECVEVVCMYNNWPRIIWDLSMCLLPQDDVVSLDTKLSPAMLKLPQPKDVGEGSRQ